MVPLIIGLLVLGRIAAACWSNVLQKRAINDARLLGVTPTALEMLVAIWALMTVALSPWWLPAMLTDLAHLVSNLNSGSHGGAEDVNIKAEPIEAVNSTWAFWGWMTLACGLEVPGNFLLLRSIQRTDLSIFGPLSSYKPIVGMLLGWWILAELPTTLGIAGVSIVLVGSLLLADRSQASPSQAPVGDAAPSNRTVPKYYFGLQHRGVRDRLTAVALTAAGSIFLKLAMQHRDTLTALAAWSLISCLFAFGWLLCDRQSSKVNFLRIAAQRDLLGIAASMIVMQGLTILVFQAMNVGYALALFQLGSLVSVYLGHRLFGEVDFYRRLLAASIMFVGAVVIVLAG